MIGKVVGSSGSVAHEMGRKEKVKPFLVDILFIDKSYQILEFFAGNGNAKKMCFSLHHFPHYSPAFLSDAPPTTSFAAWISGPGYAIPVHNMRRRPSPFIRCPRKRARGRGSVIEAGTA
jgi:hypothetical protein